jgi:hypothetical protein
MSKRIGIINGSKFYIKLKGDNIKVVTEECIAYININTKQIEVVTHFPHRYKSQREDEDYRLRTYKAVKSYLDVIFKQAAAILRENKMKKLLD